MKTKDFLIIIGLVLWIFILAGIFGDHSDTSQQQTVEQPTASVPDFSSQLQKEMDKKNLLSDATMMYTPSTKYLSVALSEGAYWDGKQLLKEFAIDTCDVMTVASSHPNEIVGVTITGYAPMMDSKGNEMDTKVYMAKIAAIDTGVNWDNLKVSDNRLGAIQNNFDSVWWHPSLTK